MIAHEMTDGKSKIDMDKYPPKLAVTLELCAGIIDKDLPIIEIAREEVFSRVCFYCSIIKNYQNLKVLEECGYDVPVSRLEEIMKYRSGVGTSGNFLHFPKIPKILLFRFVGSLQTLFYCSVKDSDKLAGSGGGVDDEIIEVVNLSLEDARKMVQKGTTHASPPSFLFGILYFLTNLAPK